MRRSIIWVLAFLVGAVFAYESCINLAVQLWLRSPRGAVRLSLPTHARTAQVAGAPLAPAVLRGLLSRPRLWYPGLVTLAPQLEISTPRAGFWFSGDAVEGGGTFWLPPLPYGAQAQVSPGEMESVAALERRLKLTEHRAVRQ